MRRAVDQVPVARVVAVSPPLVLRHRCDSRCAMTQQPFPEGRHGLRIEESTRESHSQSSSCDVN